MKKFLTLLVITLLCCSCAPLTPYSSPDEGKAPEVNKDSNSGYLVGTIGHKRWGPFGSHTFIYHEIAFSRKGHREEKPIVIRFLNGHFGDSVIDFKETGSQGTAFLIPLAPGEYELHGIKFTSDDGGSIERKPKGEFSISFSVVANKRTYIGEFLACTYAEGNKAYKAKYGVPGFFWLSNQFDRDAKILNNKYPLEANIEIINSVPVEDAPPYITHSKTALGS